MLGANASDTNQGAEKTKGEVAWKCCLPVILAFGPITPGHASHTPRRRRGSTVYYLDAETNDVSASLAAVPTAIRHNLHGLAMHNAML